MADISVFLRDTERAKHYDAIIKDLPCEKIEELVSKSKSHLLKGSRSEIPDCGRDIVYKKSACEKFPNKTKEYMKNLDKFDISSKESKQYMLDGGIAYDRRTVSTFRGEGW